MESCPPAPRVPAAETLVCVIDDDLSVRTALGRLLDSAGIRSRTFASAMDFLRASDIPAGACIISDIMMHGLSGLDLSRRLREAGTHHPTIFVTAHDTEATREEAERSGAAAYFRKPVDADALLAAVRQALGFRDPSPI